jgi:hypothetical protein
MCYKAIQNPGTCRIYEYIRNNSEEIEESKSKDILMEYSLKPFL